MNYLLAISLLHAVITRLSPTCWALLAGVPGQGFSVRVADSLAVVTGFVGASGAGIALAWDGGLGDG
jgi:hypothetical protein